MEVQIGGHTKRQEDACSSPYFNRSTLPYITLVSKYDCVYLYVNLFVSITRYQHVIAIYVRVIPPPKTIKPVSLRY